jgi:hypothetical protein
MPVPADDDMIVHRDPERLRDLRDLPRHLDVGTRRSRIAGRVIAQESSALSHHLEFAAFLGN